MDLQPNLDFSQEKKNKIKELFIKIQSTSIYSTNFFNELYIQMLFEIGAETIGNSVYYKNSTVEVDFSLIHKIVGFDNTSKP